MARLNADVIVSTELECLTATPSAPSQVELAMGALLKTIAKRCPALPGPAGIFTPYGRVYIDCGHIELAAIECHSPYVLARIVERLQWLVARARDELAARGIELLLANNNFSELLHPDCAVWGSHENYLLEKHPSELTGLILPFLVTRIYGGAGGIEFPTGNYLAGARPLCMEAVTGGGTTGNRAIHSTCREEHHMGETPGRFRYHGILGDGHRSHFNIALQFGATMLALKAAIYDKKLRTELARIDAFRDDHWLEILRRLNVLQRPEGELQIDPLVIRVQRIYLAAARRYVERLGEAPDWFEELLRDWEETLEAFERLDRPWLSARLDAFAKYEVYSSVLSNEGLAWSDLPQRPHLFPELTLLDHSYHNFCDRRSVFALLEQEGLLAHRVGPFVPPGEEREPYVPEVSTRAAARARFIREHAGEDHYIVDWPRAWDYRNSQSASLEDPFAREFGPWRSVPEPGQNEVRSRRSLRQLRELLGSFGDTPF